MSIKIEFDSANNPKDPTLVLIAKNGEKIGPLRAYDIKIGCHLGEASPLHFKVYKRDCIDVVWNKLTDFKIVWAKEWNMLFEAKVKIQDGDDPYKDVLCNSLGESELSQINLYNLEINTEDDIKRDDYEPSVLYDSSNLKRSILNRVIKNAPSYSIRKVDETIKGMQRSFSFNEENICSALKKISEEINCLIQINCSIDSNGDILRCIDVFDLESYCFDCNHRGEFWDSCDKCGSTNIKHGYGDDTTIYVTTNNLADEITYECNTGAVKNCFRLEAGDELMTETIVNCNPGGSRYLWYIPDDVKADMSEALAQRLDSYYNDVSKYQNDHIIDFSKYSGGSNLVQAYNDLASKYSATNSGLSSIPSPLRGYVNLMKLYYDTIDFEALLRTKLVPNVIMPETNAAKEAEKIGSGTLPNVSVKDIKRCTTTTANNAVLMMVKTIVDTARFQVRIQTSNYLNQVWTGSFTITSYTDENDMATTQAVTVHIDDNYERYVKQKIDKIINNKHDLPEGTAKLFELNDFEFKMEIKKYCLTLLSSFHSACQSCLDIMIEQRMSDEKSEMYDTYYSAYYKKLGYLSDEIKVRESEIEVITGVKDDKGFAVHDGIQTIIIDERNSIQGKMNLRSYLGENLWNELALYRRDDVFKNENYVSDGLGNTELFNRAIQFINIAQKEIYKSSCLQHTITAKLQNLLVMREFAPITKYFKIGNWIRVNVDGGIFRLRLLEFEVDFDNMADINVVFSDVVKTINGLSDLESILNNANAMSSTFPFVSRQAQNGADGNELLSHWVKDGLALTNMKIVNAADNQNISWDSHGLLCKEYFPDLEEYDDRQLKLINKGLYLTDDNWRTSRSGIGNFNFYNPKTGRHEERYGVIADTLVGDLVLSEEIGVYNENNTISLDKNGLIITTDNTDGKSATVFKIQRKEISPDGTTKFIPILSLNDDGKIFIENYVDNTESENIARRVMDDFKVSIETSVNDLSKQVDNMVMSWFGSVAPMINNFPANEWTTVDQKESHIGDTYYMDDGSQNGEYVYRWVKVDNAFKWEEIRDAQVIKAMRDAASAKDTADKKRRTFLSTPYAPYDPGDIWMYTPSGCIMVAITRRGADDRFSEFDWQRADNYIDNNGAHEIAKNEASIKLSEYDKIMSNRFDGIEEHNKIVDDRISERYNAAIKYSNQIFKDYMADLGQYIRYDNNGLTLGASSSAFKTTIDNQGMYFREGAEVVSYVNNRQLHIPHAVIENTLILGNFFFSPGADGSVSLTWEK